MALERIAAIGVTALCVTALSACSGGWWPFGRSAGEVNRIPANATEYTCAEGKRLIVRFDPKSAWVFLPDREFRLDRSADERYSNGASTLSLQGDNAQLDIDGSRQFADCKRKSS